MKRLAVRAPDLDIFSSHYVLRDASGWKITDAGRSFLTLIEAPVLEQGLVKPDALQPVAAARPLPANVIPIADHRARRRGRAAA